MKKLMTIMVACLLVFGLAAMAGAAEESYCGNCDEAGLINRGCEGTPGQGQQIYCHPFDFEDCGIDAMFATRSYCEGKDCNNRAWFDLCECFPTITSGQTIMISMEILVDKGAGARSDNGVYWAQDVDTLAARAYRNQVEACEDTVALDPEVGFKGGWEYWYYDRVARTVEIDGTPYDGTNCTLTDEQRVYKIANDTADPTAGWITEAAKGTIRFDMPSMRVESNPDLKGAHVWVRVCIEVDPAEAGQPICDDCCCDIYIGQLCCEDEEDPSYAYCIQFPYLTAINAANWWYGLALNNLGSEDGDATITMYEADGDVSTGTISLSAMTTKAVSMADLASFMALEEGGDVWGDKPTYVQVTAPFPLSGVAILSNAGTGAHSVYTATECLCNTCKIKVSE